MPEISPHPLQRSTVKMSYLQCSAVLQARADESTVFASNNPKANSDCTLISVFLICEQDRVSENRIGTSLGCLIKSQNTTLTPYIGREKGNMQKKPAIATVALPTQLHMKKLPAHLTHPHLSSKGHCRPFPINPKPSCYSKERKKNCLPSSSCPQSRVT